MNRYIFIRRLRWPVIILLIGVVELLHVLGVVSRSWHFFWPLLLITLGVFMLAERAALANDNDYPSAPYPPYPGSPYPGAPYGSSFSGGPVAPQTPQPGSAIVTSHPNDFSSGSGDGSNGGQL